MEGEKEKWRDVDGKDEVGRLLIGGIPHWRRLHLMPPIPPGGFYFSISLVCQPARRIVH